MAFRLSETTHHFMAHDVAPSAEAAYKWGSAIPVDLGDFALKSMFFLPHFEYADFDISTNPPTLRLKAAPMHLFGGEIKWQGGVHTILRQAFQRHYEDMDSAPEFQVTGPYTGPGSELEAVEMIPVHST